MSNAQMFPHTQNAYTSTHSPTTFQLDRNTIKFLSDKGYAVLNFDNELVTAVPQKWRNKYNAYLESKE